MHPLLYHTGAQQGYKQPVEQNKSWVTACGHVAQQEELLPLPHRATGVLLLPAMSFEAAGSSVALFNDSRITTIAGTAILIFLFSSLELSV